MSERVFNFNPGPAALPLEVLQEIQRDLINYKGEGLSVMEMSHRSKAFEAIIKGAENLMKEIMGIPAGYKVLYLQGGATLQFAAVPLNLIGPGQHADYINTGSWAKKAIGEAKKLGKEVNVIATSEDVNYSRIPKDFKVTPDAAYLHITSNNTIAGTQFSKFPDTGKVTLVCDMSSDFNCRKIDVSKFGLIYAGAQKNMGPAGVTIVIIREDLMQKSPDNIPTMTSYKILGEKDSLYNTPPCFSIYVVKLVLEWIKKQGGLSKIEEINEKKAALLYNAIDATDFYKGTVEKDSRSIMNVTYRLPSEDLEKEFIAQGLKNGLLGLKGHRSVGGIRASIYNAVSLKAVESLVSFMKDFEKKNG
ncbi:MAG: 3-phosphoserine/phosphohydroxythreonine transaminase [Calditrichaceae bacterium]|nr:3-phosphoserine/phosphohydroxythreonine transaminase [Calditrichaceae bacterium]MBN2710756.1 3-phosphoserine/phosphohydroxythreonine transaminase [Calditrichaceae bacterium]RQV95706.1 MAG: 3-phosphoserine/phosphohydroxythreonine transaminase [Calditrichota bacterium]